MTLDNFSVELFFSIIIGLLTGWMWAKLTRKRS